MSYAVLSQVKKKEVIGDAMPAGILKDSNVQFDKKNNNWLVTCQNGRMYQVKGADYYTRRVDSNGSEEELRKALRNIDFTNWIGWSTLDSLKARYTAAHCKPTVSSRQPRSIDYVIDEDQTVRWNREQNTLYNDSIQSETAELIKQKDEAVRKVQEEIACHMVFLSEGKMSLSQARALWAIIDDTPMGLDEKLNLLDSMCEYWHDYITL